MHTYKWRESGLSCDLQVEDLLEEDFMKRFSRYKKVQKDTKVVIENAIDQN